MARGRKAIDIHVPTFQGIITQIEIEKSPTTRAKLWSLVEQSRWAKSLSPRPLTAQVAMLKAKELGEALVITTPIGKRGREKGQGPVVEAGKARRKRTATTEAKRTMLTQYGPEMAGSVNRACAGSMKAAVKLLCLDCSGHSKKEVSLCPMNGKNGNTACPLWEFRPYQSKKEVKAATVLQEAEEKFAEATI